ncbi:MAG: universal stress protein [Flavobacteriales bacterium]
MQQILVPTDFSECAENAKDTAIHIAERNGATIHLLHSVNTPVDWREFEAYTRRGTIPFSGGGQAELHSDFNTAVEAIESKMGEATQEAEAKSLEACSHVVYNYNYNDIVKWADEKEMDLIVMGSHGASGWNELFVGSITQRVVRTSEVPVLVVKGDNELRELHDLVFASDFEEPEASTDLKEAISFAKIFGAKLHMLFVNTPRKFEDSMHSYEKMDRCLSEVTVDIPYEQHVFNEYSIEDGVRSFAERENMGSISIATHGYTGVKRLFDPNVTEHLINHSDRPVLCLTKGR